MLSMTCDLFSIANFQLFLPTATSTSTSSSGRNDTTSPTSASTPVATIKGHSPLVSLFKRRFAASISTSATFGVSLTNVAGATSLPNTAATSSFFPNPHTGDAAPTIDLLVRGSGLNDHAATLVKLDKRGQEVVLARIEREMWRVSGERISVWVEGGVDWVVSVAVVVAMKLRRRRR